MLLSPQDCIICMEKLSLASGYSDVTDSRTMGPRAVGRLAKCSHAFHLLCLLAMYCNGNKVPGVEVGTRINTNAHKMSPWSKAVKAREGTAAGLWAAVWDEPLAEGPPRAQAS